MEGDKCETVAQVTKQGCDEGKWVKKKFKKKENTKVKKKKTELSVGIDINLLFYEKQLDFVYTCRSPI